MKSGASGQTAESVDGQRYRLISIDAVRTPQGCVGSDWHLYRIVQGENGITGYRRGNLTRVTIDVEEIVAALNGRLVWAKDKASAKSARRALAAARRTAAT